MSGDEQPDQVRGADRRGEHPHRQFGRREEATGQQVGGDHGHRARQRGADQRDLRGTGQPPGDLRGEQRDEVDGPGRAGGDRGEDHPDEDEAETGAPQAGAEGGRGGVVQGDGALTSTTV